MTRRTTRPSAASRTACLYCRVVGCGGACLATTTPPDRPLGIERIAVAIDLARAWAARLCAGVGLLPRAAAHVAARHFGVDPKDVYVEHAPQLARAWTRGSLERPTGRPSREFEDEEFEMDRSEQGAA